ncbi:hypothetical protein P1P68_05925 [Streptomyces scabiei]|uniref:hypothetical protein n=1 Tax=Streptomyces scabiei TaxID=1930 RepID=UPI00298FB4BC|nr:hypothetical protein [Streptomyces scabiei]MDW8804340.1 hypothetical protein [Streptomyces scabiei]
MTTPYTIDHSDLTVAIDEAHGRIQRGQERLARVACALIAAAVRDSLTGHDPDPAAPFDATHLRLTLNQHQRVVTDGTYWTADGEKRRITDSFDLAEWPHELDHYNRAAWEPLCEHEATAKGETHYRLNLAKAAALPAEIQNTARVAEIRDRLAAASRRPWNVEEYVTNRNGGIVASDDPEAVHTDFIVEDADRIRVAEIAINHDGPGDTETPAEDIAESRANAQLIAHAPEDLQFLVAYLDHLGGGEDAEAAHLRGYCGDCGTALYTSTPSETPTELGGGTLCKGSRLAFLPFELHHVLRH